MKILQLNTIMNTGGASRAVLRLNKSLRRIGVDSQIFARESFWDNWYIRKPQKRYQQGLMKLMPFIDKIPLKFYIKRMQILFSLQWIGCSIQHVLKQFNPDIVHLHWICDGFLRVESLLSIKQPVVWTFHDMWPLTGGCHYSGSCRQYESGCGLCPQLNSKTENDLSLWGSKRKQNVFNRLNPTIVAPSKWLGRCAKNSIICQDIRVEIIPNGIDLTKFKPVNQSLARKVFNLPKNKKLLLFCAITKQSDKRKGFDYLKAVINSLKEQGGGSDIELVLVGVPEQEAPHGLGLKTHSVGVLYDEYSLSLIYSAVDASISPSVEDNLPNTVAESLSCGTPCIAFNIGGMADMITHRENGYLALPFDVEDFADGVKYVLRDDMNKSIRINSRKKAEKYLSDDKSALRHRDLYEELLSSRK